jgi:hypothetical protein
MSALSKRQTVAASKALGSEQDLRKPRRVLVRSYEAATEA